MEAWAGHPSPVSLSVDLTVQCLWGRKSGLETQDELGKQEGQLEHAVGGHRDGRVSFGASPGKQCPPMIFLRPPRPC